MDGQAIPSRRKLAATCSLAAAALAAGVALQLGPVVEPTISARAGAARARAHVAAIAGKDQAPRALAVAMSSPASYDAIQALREESDPLAAIEAAIDDMSRDELTHALIALTGSDPEALDAQRNLHDYAKSLAGIALAGVATPPNEAPSPDIDFAARLADALSAPREPSAHPSSQARMFGVFELAPGTQTRVLAKWYRVSPPELLMFESVPIRSQEGKGFIRLDRATGWVEGEYRLEVYTTEPSPELIASGDFSTQGEQGPRAVLVN